MKFSPILSRKIIGVTLSGRRFTLSVVTAILLSGSLVHPAEGVEESKASGLIQEKIGSTVQALGRFDQQRQSRLQEQWTMAVRQLGNLDYGRDARLQEELGHAIVRTTQVIMSEQISLKKAVVEATKKFEKFQQERSARWQEQLGLAVLWAARRAPAGGEAFQAAFQKNANLLKKIDERTSRRLEAHLQALLTRQAEFQNTIPLLYQEVIQSTHRSVWMLEESQITRTNQVLKELTKQMDWKRQSQDYVQLASVVQENLLAHYRESKAEGYGFLALLGLILGTVWVASISRHDQVGSSPFAPAGVTSFEIMDYPTKTLSQDCFTSLDLEGRRAMRYTYFVSLLTIEIDQNEGDELLITLADLIRKWIRNSDILSRSDHRRVSVILPHAETSSLFSIGERIRGGVENHDFIFKNSFCKRTVSVGGACFPTHTSDIHGLLPIATEMLLKAMHVGGNKVYLPSIKGPNS